MKKAIKTNILYKCRNYYTFYSFPLYTVLLEMQNNIYSNLHVPYIIFMPREYYVVS